MPYSLSFGCRQGMSASEMTCIVSGGALNSTLTQTETGHQAEGVHKGRLSPSATTRGLGEHRDLPSGVRNRAPTENEFGAQ